MAGVNLVRLNNLNLDANNKVIVGIIIAKTSPRNGIKKNNGESGGVMSFTLRDSTVDTINADVWGSENYVNTFYEKFLVGDVVEISSPRIRLKGPDMELYKPHVSSPFYLTLNEGVSVVNHYTGDSYNAYLPLLHIPTKPDAGYTGLAELLKIKTVGLNTFVDLLVVVKTIRPTKTIKTAAGADMLVRSIEVIDDTTPATLVMDLYDTDNISRADQWHPLETVLFVADARVTRRSAAVSIRISCATKTVVTPQPHSGFAETLRLKMQSRGDDVAAWSAWSGERVCVLSSADVAELVASAAPFCVGLFALLTHLDLKPLSNPNVEELEVRFTDHRGEISARLPINVLAVTLAYSVDQLKRMSADDRAKARWKVLLEYCIARVTFSNNRLTVLSLKRATCADPIPAS